MIGGPDRAQPDADASAAAIKDALFALSELDEGERAQRLEALKASAPALAQAVEALLPGALQTQPGVDAVRSWAQSLGAVGLPQRLGPWRVLHEIGRGGMGVVLLGERADGAFDMRVAIKVLPPMLVGGSGAARLSAEARVLGRLAHPHIARLLDAGFEQGCAYLVMEHVDGMPITVHAQRAALAVPERLRLMLELCAAVQFAHAQLLVHRDIKPANVMVDVDGRVRLLDFGIAKVVEGDQATHTWRQACTPAYASPEQLRGQPVSVATDVFSLGVLLYELLTGRRPFGPENVSTEDAASPTAGLRVMQAVLEQEPAAAPLLQAGVPADLRAVVLKALEKPLPRRYASVEGLAADLRAFLDGRPVSAQPPGVAYRLRKFVARNAWAVGGGALAGAAMLGFAAWALHSARLAEAQRLVALRRLEAVRSIANKVVFDYNAALRPLPGTLAVRRTLVADALSYLDALGREAEDDAALQADIASGFEAVGDVQGRGATDGNLGDLDGARVSYERAVSLRRALCDAGAVAAAPRAAACGAYARALVRLGDNRFTAGQTPEAIEHFEAASRAAQRALAAPAGADAHARDDALDARFDAAQRLAGLSGRQTGEAFARGLALAREQLQAAEALAAARSGPATQEAVRVANDLLAVRLLGSGQADAALLHMRRSVALAREIGQRLPGRDASVSLAVSLTRLAEIQAHRLQFAEARVAMQEGLVLARGLHLAEPQDMHLRARYANVARRWAQVNNLIGDAAALQANHRDLPQALAASSLFRPSDGVFFMQHQQLLVELAQTQLSLGRSAAALQTLAALPADLPPQPRAAADLAPLMLLRARAWAALGRDAEAAQAFDAGHEALRQAVEATPADVQQAGQLVQAQRWALQQPALASRHAALAAESSRRLAELRAGAQLTPWWQQTLR